MFKFINNDLVKEGSDPHHEEANDEKLNFVQ